MFCVPRLSRLVLILISFCWCPLSVSAEVSGRAAKWHPIQVDVIGPQASELDISPNPFLDYLLSVEFKAPSGAITVVPGF